MATPSGAPVDGASSNSTSVPLSVPQPEASAAPGASRRATLRCRSQTADVRAAAAEAARRRWSCACFGRGQASAAKPPVAASRAAQLAADAALLRGAALGHVDTVKQCIAAGANLATRDKLGDTAMHEAARAGHVGCLEALLDAGAPTSQANLVRPRRALA